MIVSQRLGKLVRVPAQFPEVDIEHGLQKFELIEQIFSLLAPFVQCCVVPVAGTVVGFASGLVDPSGARNNGRRFRIEWRQIDEVFGG